MEKSTNFPLTVSIITPARNASAVLARAVRSVQAQTSGDWEMIIVDDGSKDGTAGLAQDLAQMDPRLRVLRHATGQGAAAARNTALAVAQGRYIAFLDADDSWTPDKLEVQLRTMLAADAGLSYTGFWRVSETHQHRVHVPSHVTRAQLLRGNCIGCSTAMYDRRALGSVKMADLPMRQDYALWLTLLADLPDAVGIDTPLARVHVTRGSLSSNKARALRATWGMHHRYFGVGRLRAAFYVLSHMWRRLRRG